MKDYLKMLKRMNILQLICISLMLNGVAAAIHIYSNTYYSKMVASIGSTNKFLHLAKIFIGLEILYFIIDRFSQYKDTGFKERTAKKFKDMLFERALHLTIRDLEETSNGKIVSAANMCDSMCNQTYWMPCIIVQTGTKFIMSYIILFMADKYLSIVLAAVSAISAIIFYIANNSLKSLSEKKIKYSRKMIEYFNNLRCFSVIKGFCREGDEYTRFEKITEKYRRISVRRRLIYTSVLSTVNMGQIIIYAIIIWYIIRNNYSMEKGVLFFTLIDNAYYPLFDLPNILNSFSELFASIKNWTNIVDKDVEDYSGIELTEFNNSVEFKSVSCSYDKSDNILSNINLVVKKGTKLGIYGPSGSGKSTFINLLCKFMKASKGSILVDNIPIDSISNESLRSKIGIVSQDIYLFNDTIINNIRYGNPNATESDIIEAAKKANIHEFISSLKDGYNSNIGNEGVKLSGGQKQRLSIARMLLADPDIIILDEATSKLDTESEKAVQLAIDNLEKGKTVFSIAHRLSTLNNCDMLIGIDNHTICEKGTRSELLADPNSLFSKLSRMQQ